MKSIVPRSPLKSPLLFMVVLILAVVVFLGQGCQVHFSGNGGGYGGFKVMPGDVDENPPAPEFENDGTYAGGSETPRSPVSQPTSGTGAVSEYDHAFYHFSNAPVCVSAVPALGEAGNFMSGMIAVASNGALSYRADSCSPAVTIVRSQITSADFDPVTWVYQDRPFTRYGSAPQDLSQIRRSLGYCLALDASNSRGVDTGTSVAIYRENGVIHAAVYLGAFEDGAFRRYRLVVNGLAISSDQTSAEFSVTGFRLRIEAPKNGRGSGFLEVPRGSSVKKLGMDCLRLED